MHYHLRIVNQVSVFFNKQKTGFCGLVMSGAEGHSRVNDKVCPSFNRRLPGGENNEVVADIYRDKFLFPRFVPVPFGDELIFIG